MTDTRERDVTYRVCGRDFTGPADTLAAWHRAERYATRQVLASSNLATVKVFMVSPGCLPVEVSRVHASRAIVLGG